MSYFENMSGAVIASGFKLHAKAPIDPRLVVDTVEDLTALVEENGAYEGMTVYVKADKCTYTLKGTTAADWSAAGGAVDAAADSEVGEMLNEIFG